MLRHHHERLFTMFSRRNLIQHACPTCTAEYWYLAERAGSDTTCNKCNSTYAVPTGLPVQLQDVSTNPGRPLTPEETAAFYASHPEARAMVPRRTVPSELVAEPYERMPDARYPVARHDDDKKVKLSFLKLLGLEIDVDGKTRNAIALTALGGILVGLGAIIAAKFGFKSKA